MASSPRLEVLSGGKGADDWDPVPPIDVVDPNRLRTIDHDAERAVLSNVIVDATMLLEVRPWLLPEHFESESHRRIFAAVCDLTDRNLAVDVVSVASELRGADRLAQVGGMAYLTALLNAAPVIAPAHVQRYGRVVRDLAVRRQFAALGTELTSRAENDMAGIDVLIADAHTRLEVLAATLAQNELSIRADAVVDRTFAELTKASEPSEVGRATGFDRLDRILTGLPKDLVVLAAVPGMGKTSLASGIGVNVAKRGGAVYVASLETTEVPLMTRVLCAEAGVDVKRALLADLGPEEWRRLTAAGSLVHALPLYLDTDSTMSVGELWPRCRRLQLQLARQRPPLELELVIVDYAQLLREPRGARKRHEAVATNVRTLQKMAHQLGCTVLALSQVNGENENRKNLRPQLRDLAESSEFRKCARTILFLYREDFYDEDASPGVAEVIVAKQNNGPRGTALLRFDASSTRFGNLPEGEGLFP